jgi:hypothetical protein
MAYLNKGRDVFSLMERRGEQGMKEAIIKIAEDNSVLNQQMKDMMSLLDRIVDEVAKAHMVADKLITENDKLKRKFFPNNEGNPDGGYDA